MSDRPGFAVRRRIARVLLRLARWRTTGQVPERGILVGAPHTSNWDWVLTLLLAWDSRVRIRLLVKKSLFRGPLGPLLRSTGAVALDRSDPGPTIRRLLADAADDEAFLLGIAAEGTRGPGEYWKSGFYRISQQTGIPVTLAFLDVPSRTVGWGPTFELTGDVRADMDRLRAFYADKRGFRPENAIEPRLRSEG
ncbi:1-acyl-sn-glycerol-3-phosphate acyltransferase [Nocardioides zeae]|uniref:1-acyl-sn-glycerol-3-phosphate acyltransferase n=1 Tax=Nocardioides imazamoxiresistens TaxID=3231893 RepID=A0ABU3PT30_9ACTN|nr:1-acyl-sn-glycerol-3-phosphate acyltransferase [Nocardioides zeae]MDT9591945.1 1-acyl-sn-glycerol-3-phosphate acyltransferase [Nocardioides zeae]